MAPFFMALESKLNAVIKHDNMKGRIDFTKIVDKDGKLLGVLNFNLMIPVEDEQMQKVDFRSNKK